MYLEARKVPTAPGTLGIWKYQIPCDRLVRSVCQLGILGSPYSRNQSLSDVNYGCLVARARIRPNKHFCVAMDASDPGSDDSMPVGCDPRGIAVGGGFFTSGQANFSNGNDAITKALYVKLSECPALAPFLTPLSAQSSRPRH